MNRRRMDVAVLGFISVFATAVFLLGAVPRATAETMTGKGFNHATKTEMFPVGDVEGHFIGVIVREGPVLYETGEWAWLKATVINDTIKGAGTVDQYATFTFQDGSTFTSHVKGTVEAAPTGVSSAGKFTGDVINGTGRFQGIKGTHTISAKMLPPQEGEIVGKAFGEETLVYTLPGK